jgi:hemoglobin/transferrin/lactoferrin receptor protein
VEGLRFRGSYAVITGNDVSGPTEMPLNSVAPDQGVAGLEYTAKATRFGGELSVRSVRGQDPASAGAGFYAPKAYAVADFTGWLKVSELLKLRLGVLNLTDKKYFEWPNVRGRSATDPTIDRYSSPGISAVASISVGW